MQHKYLIPAVVMAIFSCNKPASNDVDAPTAIDVSWIDSTVDPCDNFYDYAIGNWKKDNPIPETESRWYAMNILFEENRERLISIIDELIEDKHLKPGSEEQQIRDLFLSGIDSIGRAKAGISAIEPLLQQVDAAGTHGDIMALFGSLAALQVSTPLSFSIGADRQNSAMNAVYLNQSGLSLPDRDYYLIDNERFGSIRQKYAEHIDRMMGYAGVTEPTGDKVLALEIELARMSWSRQQNRDAHATYNVKKTKQYFGEMQHLDLDMISRSSGFRPFEKVIVRQPSYMHQLDSLFGATSVDTWKDYLRWKTVSSFAGTLSVAMEEANFDFNGRVLRGTQQMKTLKKRVFNRVNSGLGEPMGKMFVQRYFDEESKAYMAEMIENLRSAYKESILALDWMSDATKEKALKKLASFTYKVGYPDEWRDYSSIEITPDNYAQNAINIRKYYYNRMLEKQGQPVDRKEWGMTPQMVNAYYNSSNNEIVFPAGILQPPFFHKNYDHAINYGGIGAVIGHEFSHGFDDNGSKYDWDGNLNDWWTAEDRAKFEALAARLGQQYDQYSPVEGMNVNGKLTMGENIADLGGVTLAYGALQKAYNGEFPESIDGFTWQQRFFLAWANVWKGDIKEEQLVSQLKSDPHSPAQYRVIGPLVNFKPYEEAFGVCQNKPMYKPDSAKIKIW